MPKFSDELLKMIQDEGPKLAAISEADACTRHGGGPGWTRKEELGHLLDSATNNRIRFAVAAIDGKYIGPTYSADGWASLGGYKTMAWAELVSYWRECNRMLAALIANIPEERLACHCRIDDAPPVTLQFLIEDYALHMQHHLDHIQGREASTSYPGANLGV